MYDLLKDLQPTFAASIALCAAALAYLSAMAKVRLDKTEAARKRASEELRLYLRIRVTLMGIRELRFSNWFHSFSRRLPSVRPC